MSLLDRRTRFCTIFCINDEKVFCKYFVRKLEVVLLEIFLLEAILLEVILLEVDLVEVIRLEVLPLFKINYSDYI